MPAHDPPLLYGELASWFHVLTPPEDYAAEAAIYLAALRSATRPCETLLELGSGGGNNAVHLKAHLRLTLTDLSPAMLAESRRLNPECEHVEGDMRTLRLGRTFDAVLLHDAVMYLTTEDDLRRALVTAREHLRPGGAALLAPDHVRETFAPATEHGGSDRGGRALRYLEWVWDPDPGDTEYVADYVYALREADGEVRVVHDRHVEGVFPRDTWRRLLREVGLEERTPPPHDRREVGEIFLAVRRP
jgi:trans-aconitate methyltransferase